MLILLNAYFVAAEYGLVTVRRTRMHELAPAGQPARAGGAADHGLPPRFIAAMQLGVTLTSLAIGALGEHALAKAFDPVLATVLAVLLAYLILTFLHVVIGELVPKGGRAWLLRADGARRLRAGARVLRRRAPLIWLLQRSTEVVLRAVRAAGAGRRGQPCTPRPS